MKRGGKRPGAGRKQGVAARNAEEARRVLSEMVIKEIESIGKALIKKAKAGDIAASRELMDRAFGRVVQMNTEFKFNDSLREIMSRAKKRYS